MAIFRTLFVLSWILLTAASLSAQTTWYLRFDGDNSQDGLTPATAKREIADLTLADGDVIDMGPGTYAAATITASVHFAGANAGNATYVVNVGGVTPVINETTLGMITINAADKSVTFEGVRWSETAPIATGFNCTGGLVVTVTNSHFDQASSINATAAGGWKELYISECDFDGADGAVTSMNAVTVSGLEIANISENQFRQYTESAISLTAGSGSAFTVRYNEFTGNNTSATGQANRGAIVVTGHAGLTSAEIHNNVFTTENNGVVVNDPITGALTVRYNKFGVNNGFHAIKNIGTSGPLTATCNNYGANALPSAVRSALSGSITALPYNFEGDDVNGGAIGFEPNTAQSCATGGPVKSSTTEGAGTSYFTISEAITASTSGAVVRVLADTYNENLTINKRLKVLCYSDPAGRTPVDVDTTSDGRSRTSFVNINGTITITSTADEVELNGLKVTRPGTLANVQLVTTNASLSTKIRNCSFVTTSGGSNGLGSSAPTNGVVHVVRSGDISIWQSSIARPGSSEYIRALTFAAGNGSRNVRVERSAVQGTLQMSGLSALSNVLIDDNLITDAGVDGVAVTGNFARTLNVTNNTITNARENGVAWKNGASVGANSATVAYNLITGSGQSNASGTFAGIFVGSQTAGSTQTYSNNSIHSQNTGKNAINQRLTASLNAACNWWGHISEDVIITGFSGAGTVNYDNGSQGWYGVGTNTATGNGFAASGSCSARSFTFTLNKTNISCDGSNNGSITATPAFASGDGAASYSWSNSTSAQTATGLAAGTYSVTVTANSGNYRSQSATVYSPTAITAVAAPTDITCFAATDGIITITTAAAGGEHADATTRSYQYSVKNSVGGALIAGPTSNLSFTGLDAGTYDVFVTAIASTNGSTITNPACETEVQSDLVIVRPALLTTSSTVTSVICNATTATMTVTFSGGVGPYNLAWTGGGSATGVTSPYTITGLAVGTYEATVTDKNLCTSMTPNSIIYTPVTNTTTGLHYATIQGAIDAATAGDVIEVCYGTFTENLTVNKRLTIDGHGSGSDPASNTVITSAAADTPVVNLTASGLSVAVRIVIKDVRLTGTTGTPGNNTTGIYASSTPVVPSYVTINNVTFANNVGDGITFNMQTVGADVTDWKVLNSTFTSNRIGIRVAGNADVDGLLIDGCSFTSNTQFGIQSNATPPTSPAFNNSTNWMISNTTFTGNGTGGPTTTSRLGNVSILGFNGNLTVSNVVIDGQNVGADHGFSLSGRGDATVSPVISAASAGTMSFTNLTIQGNFRRPGLAAINPGGQGRAFSIKTYSDVSNVTFSNVELLNGEGNSLEAMGINGTLDIGDMEFGAPSGTLGTGTAPSGENDGTRKMYSIVTRASTHNTTGKTDVNASSSTFSGLNVNTLAEAFSIADRVLDAVDDGARGYVSLKSGNVYVTSNSYDLATSAPSIQRGVTVATVSDVVNVKAGTYTQSVTVDKAVTVSGPNSAVTYSGTRSDEAIIAGPVVMSEAGAQLNGFELRTTSANEASHLLDVTAESVTVLNNLFKHVEGSPTTSALVMLNASAAGSTTFSGNSVTLSGGTRPNNSLNAIGTSGVTGVYNIYGNRFEVSGTGTDAYAVGLRGGTVTLDENFIEGDIAGGVIVDGYGTTGGSATILSNDILVQSGVGVRVIGSTSGATDIVDVNQNTIHDITPLSGSSTGLYVTYDGSQTSVQYNSFDGNNTAIQFDGGGTLATTCNWFGTKKHHLIAPTILGNVSYDYYSVTGVDARLGAGFEADNSTTSGKPVCLGIAVVIHSATEATPQFCDQDGSVTVRYNDANENPADFTGTMSAEELRPYTISWTGAETGSVSNVTAIGGVSTSPYTITGLSAGTYTVTVTDDNGSEATSGVVTVNYKSVRIASSGALYTSIQSAINAASAGDVIEVCYGTFTENLTVNKRLTIDGRGSGSDPASNTVITSAASGTSTIVYSAGGVDATTRQILKDVRVTGASGGTGNNNSGILLSGGSMGYFTFDNIVATGNAGHGLVSNVAPAASSLTDVIITGSTFSSNGSAGIRTASHSVSGFTVTNSSFTSNTGLGLAFNSSDNTTAQIGGVALTNVTFSGNNSVADLYAFRMLGTMSLTNVDFQGSSGAGSFGLYLLGAYSSETSAPAIAAVTLNDVTFSGTYTSAGLSFLGYSNLANVSMTDVVLNTSVPTADRAHIRLSGVAGTLNLGNTAFTSPATNPPALDIRLGSNFGSAGSIATVQVDATTATFGGKLGSAMTLGELFALEDRIRHGTDNTTDATGFVRVKASNAFVTTNSGSVQRGITVASAGDILNINSGTYTAQAVTVDKRLDIVGQGAITIIQNSGGTAFTYAAAGSGSGAAAANRAYLRNVMISGSTKGLYAQDLVNYLTLDGVTFDGNTSYAIHLNNTSGTMQDWAITNSTFNGNSDGFRMGMAANLNGLSITGTTFTSNTPGSAIYIPQQSSSPGGLNNVTITGNTFTGNGNTNNQAALYIEKLSNATISNNTLTNNGTSTNPRGMIINLKYGTYSDITISGNTLSETRGGTQTNGYAINVQGRNDATSYNSNPGTASTVAISSNVMSGFLRGIEVDNAVDWATTTISNNAISGCTFGVLGVVYGTGNTANGAGKVLTVNNNSILGATIPIASSNANGGTINAECNWYGTKKAHVIAASLSGTGIDYSPYLVDGTDDQPSTTGFQPVTGACTGTPVAVSLASQTNVSCFGGSNGSIDITVAGGTGTYTYAWTGPDSYSSTSVDISSLKAGTYNVTATDGNESEGTLQVVITEPTVLVAGIASSTNATCNGSSDGEATASASGGTSGYSYSWNTTPSQSGITATGLGAGTYTVTVTDANNCTKTAQAVITEPVSLSATVASVHLSCDGANNGSITVSAPAGGYGTFETSVDGTDWFAVSTATSYQFTGLSAGTYTVRLRDAANTSCVANVGRGTAGTEVIYNPTLVSSTINKINISCNGSVDGSLTVTATTGGTHAQSGGARTFSYRAVRSTGGYDVPNATGSFTGLSAGTYTISAIAAEVNASVPACTTDVATAVIYEPSALTSAGYAVNFNGLVSANPPQNQNRTQNLSGPLGPDAAYQGGWVNVSAGGAVNWHTAAASVPFTVTNAAGAASFGMNIQFTNNGGNAGAGTSSTDAFDILYATGIRSNDGRTTVTTTGTIPFATYSVYVYATHASNSVNGRTNNESFTTSNGFVSGTNTRLFTGLSGPLTITDDWILNGFSIVGNGDLTSKSNITCAGANDGKIFFSVGGATHADAPTRTYQYRAVSAALSYDQTNSTGVFSGLLAGTYDLSVIVDASGSGQSPLCTTAVGSQVINEPTPITATVNSTNITCNSSTDGTITVSSAAGGTNADLGSRTYKYMIARSGGATTGPQTSASFTGLNTGTYTVSVIADASGSTPACTTNVSGVNPVVISRPDVLNATVASANISCNAATDGTVTITDPTGGYGTYEFRLNTGSWQSSGSFTGLNVGTYSVQIRDAAQTACTATLGSRVITRPAVLAASISSQTDVLCNGATTGAATAAATGGTGAYSYSWNSTPAQTTATATGLAAGTYTVTVTDANNCTTAAQAVITQPTLLVATVTGSTNVSCNGGSDGTATASGSGGTPGTGYTYSWNTTPEQTTATATGLVAGTYTVTVTDANSCVKTADAVITQPAALSATVASTHISCNNANDGSITVSAPAGGYGTYETSVNGTIWFDVSTSTSYQFTGLSAGTYTVRLRDKANTSCVANIGRGASGTEVIENPTALTASVTKVNHGKFSSGAYGQIIITSPSGGTTSTQTVRTYKYKVVRTVGPPTLWRGPQTSGTFDGYMEHGTYDVYMIADAVGNYPECETKISTQELLVPTPLGATVSKTNISCNGDNNGTITVTGTTGGTHTDAPTRTYTYRIERSGMTPMTSTSGAFTGLQAGTYTVFALTVEESGAYGVTPASETGFGTQVINNPSAVQASVAAVDVDCNGNANGSITVSGTSGGTHADAGTRTYQYMISQTGGATTGPQTSASFTGLNPGTYSVSVIAEMEGSGVTPVCTTSVGTSVITQPAVLTATMGTPTHVTCNGGSNGSVTVTAGGGNAGYTYLWSNSQTGATATGLVAGTYSVTVTDSKNCTATAPVTINQPTAVTQHALVVKNYNGADLSCNTASDGQITAYATGGTGSIEYQIDGGTWQSSGVFSGLSAGTYTITARDANGCLSWNDQSAILTAPPALTASTTLSNFSGFGVSCFGGSNGTATAVVGGGTGSYSYSWNTAPVQTAVTATGLAAGTYTVTVTDANGCEKTAQAVITQPGASVTASIASQVNVSCNGLSDATATAGVAGGATPYTYQWSNAQTAATATGLAAGTYGVTVTDANGCQSSAVATITQPDVLSASIASQVNVLCFGGATGTATTGVTGGTTPYSYSWTNGQTTQTATGLAAGTYGVTVTDDRGCTSSTDVTISQPASAVAITSSLIKDVCLRGESTGEITIGASGGTGTLSYTWTKAGTSGTFASTQNITGLTAGTYTVTVNDANGSTGGCAATETYEVLQPAVALAATQSKTNITCFTATDGTITVSNPVGGWDTYSAELFMGATLVDTKSVSSSTPAVFTGLNDGDYQVTMSTVKDAVAGRAALNCSATPQSTITIYRPSQLVMTYAVTNTSCGGTDGKITVTGSSGGTHAELPTQEYEYVLTNDAETLSPITQTSTEFTGLTGQVYKLSIRAKNVSPTCGRQYTGITLEGNTPLGANVAKTNIECNTNTNGTITVSGTTGGTSFLTTTRTYRYKLVNTGTTAEIGPQTSGSFEGLAAGTYGVDVIADAVGSTPECTARISTQVIYEPSTVVSTTSKINVSKNGLTDGQISFSAASGGVHTSGDVSSRSYEYYVTKSGGSTTGPQASTSFTGLSAGTYTTFVIALADGSTPACTTQVNSQTILEPTAVNASVAKINIECNGNTNGSITVSGTTGGTHADAVTRSITYRAARSGGLYDETNGTGSFTGLIAGTYTVSVIADVEGGGVTPACTTDVGTVEIMNPTMVSSTPSKTNIVCNNANDGTITTTAASGGTHDDAATRSYQYYITRSGGTPTTPSTARTFTGLQAGTYTVSVIALVEGSGVTPACTTNVGTVEIMNPTVVTATSSKINISCNGGTDGSISASGAAGGIHADAGSRTYTYRAVKAGGGYDQTYSDGSFTGLGAGTYTVSVIAAMAGDGVTPACTTELATHVINEPTLVTATVVKNNISCNGNTNGSITASSAAGGTHADAGSRTYLYRTVKSGGGYGETNSTGSFTGLGAGTYTVSVIAEASGSGLNPVCTTEVATRVIFEPTAVTSSGTIATSNPTCNSASDGSIDIVGGAGGTHTDASTRDYRYSIAKVAGSTVGPQTSALFTGLTAGTYNLIVTTLEAGSGVTPECVTTIGQRVLVDPSAVTYTFSENADTVAPYVRNGGTVTFTLTVQGGTPLTHVGTTPAHYNVTWDPSNPTEPTFVSSVAGTGGSYVITYEITGASPDVHTGSYSVSVTDNNSCASPSGALTRYVSVYSTVDLYVDNINGDHATGTGTTQRPLKSITKAIDIASANETINVMQNTTGLTQYDEDTYGPVITKPLTFKRLEFSYDGTQAVGSRYSGLAILTIEPSFVASKAFVVGTSDVTFSSFIPTALFVNNSGTVQEAINEVAEGGTLTFVGGSGGTYDLSGQLTIAKALTLQGVGTPSGSDCDFAPTALLRVGGVTKLMSFSGTGSKTVRNLDLQVGKSGTTDGRFFEVVSAGAIDVSNIRFYFDDDENPATAPKRLYGIQNSNRSLGVRNDVAQLVDDVEDNSDGGTGRVTYGAQGPLPWTNLQIGWKAEDATILTTAAAAQQLHSMVGNLQVRQTSGGNRPTWRSAASAESMGGTACIEFDGLQNANGDFMNASVTNAIVSGGAKSLFVAFRAPNVNMSPNALQVIYKHGDDKTGMSIVMVGTSSDATEMVRLSIYDRVSGTQRTVSRDFINVKGNGRYIAQIYFDGASTANRVGMAVDDSLGQLTVRGTSDTEVKITSVGFDVTTLQAPASLLAVSNIALGTKSGSIRFGEGTTATTTNPSVATDDINTLAGNSNWFGSGGTAGTSRAAIGEVLIYNTAAKTTRDAVYCYLRNKFLTGQTVDNGLEKSGPVDEAVAGGEMEAENGIFVYPNPAESDLSVSVIVRQAGRIKIEIIDALGRVVHNAVDEISQGESIYPITLDVSKYATGTYAVRVSGAVGADMTQPFIIRR